MINLFCVDAIINEETGAEGESGRAYLPYVSERHLKEMVILSIEDGLHLTGTLAHELGHFFGLHHTHGDEKKFQKELANGSNCLVAGDSLCDTPADPGLQGRVIATDPCNCRYNGNQRDRFDDPYHPLADNIMSYAPDLCLRSFTPGQLNKISYYARWRRAQFRHYYDRENKNAWMPGEYAADLVTAKEDFGLSQRKQYALMIVYHPANTWSQRLIKDLAQPSTRKIIETYDYKVVFFNVARQGKSLADYFGNHVLPQSLQESFQRLLRPGTVLVPAIFVIKFDKDREKTEVSSNFGYMNPRTLSQMLVEKGRRRTVLSK